MTATQTCSLRSSVEVGASAEAILDVVHLRRYTLEDVELERELLGLFRAQARSQFDLIVTTEDAAAFKLAIHTLKGTARAVGAFGVSKACEAMERLTMDPARARTTAQMQALRGAVAAVEHAISEMNV